MVGSSDVSKSPGGAAGRMLPYVKMVPAGVISCEGRHLLQIAAILTPDCLPQDAMPPGGPLTLQNWTSLLLGFLQKQDWQVDVVFRNATDTGANKPCLPAIADLPASQPIKAIATDLLRAFGSTDWSAAGVRDPAATLNEEWRRALNPEDVADSVWDEMAVMLSQSLDGSRLRPELEEKLAYAKVEFGKRGELADITTADPRAMGRVVSLLAVPESDLAALIDRQRALALAKTLSIPVILPAPADAASSQPAQDDEYDKLVVEMDAEEAKNKPDKARLQELGNKLLGKEKAREYRRLFASLDTRRRRAYDLVKAAAGQQARTLSDATIADSPLSSALEREEQLEKVVDAYLYETWEQSQSSGEDPNFSPLTTMGRGFFAIQSNPVLARLFGLVIDLVLPLDDLPAEWREGQTTLDMLVACTLREKFIVQASDPRALPWTLCRLHIPAGPAPAVSCTNASASGGFWPVDSAEILAETNEIQLSRNGRLTMYVGDGDKELPRFDITSLDFRGAAEIEAQRRRNLQAGSSDHTYHSLGMTLLDRFALHAAARKLASAATKCEGTAGTGACVQDDAAGNCRNLLLDASDLSTGMRLDVGVPQQGLSPATQWRPLMSRIVTYGSGRIEEYLRALLGPPQGQRRMALESPSLCQAARLMPYGGAGADPGASASFQAEAVVSESLSLWDGSPMGVFCGRAPEGNRPTDLLRSGRILALPDATAASGLRPPRLRYGWAYRFSARNVYSGGISIPLAPIDEVADAACVFPRMPRPGQQHLPYCRFLRQERIAPPMVVMPVSHALTPQGPMGYETARNMIVRSARQPTEEQPVDLASRTRPARAQRIIVVPGIAQDEAGRHGVFDASTSATPIGAFSRMVLSKDGQAFQAALTETREGPNQHPYLVGRTLSDDASGTLGVGRHVHEPCMSYRTGPRRSRYYPDPVAEKLVIVARHKLTGSYLTGHVALPLLSQAGRYPDLHPVAITLERLATPRTRPVASINDLRRSSPRNFLPPPPPRLRGFNPDAEGDIFSGTARATAWDLHFWLAPGEEYELEMWFLPSAQVLARKFALIESLSTLEARLGRTPPVDVGQGFVGPEGVIGPDPKVLLDGAMSIHNQMLRRPVPAIAAVTRIGLTHAVNRPAAPPVLAVPPSDACGEIVRQLTVRRPQSLADAAHDSPKIFPGATTFMLSGHISLDLCAASAFEIEAEMAMPPGSIFDDHKMRRSLLKRRAGEWPHYVDAQGRPQQRPPRDVFGFDMENDDLVALPKSRHTVLRVDDLEYVLRDPQNVGQPIYGPIQFEIAPFFRDPDPARKMDGQDRAVQQQLIETDGWICPPSGGPAIRVTVRGRTSVRMQIPDTKARAMTLTARAISRTARLFDSVNLQDAGGVFRHATSIEPGLQSISTPPEAALKITIPSTERPSQCNALTPHPVFAWTVEDSKTIIRRERIAMIRIRLERGWFSSGEGEQIGVVLWPPNLFAQSELSTNRVRLRDPVSRGVDLGDFTDVDLGPGGAFITRKGADPIRDGNRDTRLFLSPGNFPDLRADCQSRFHPTHPCYQPSVRMPVAKTRTIMGEDLDQPMLDVGLLLLEPRFDMEEEIWYADLQIRPEYASDPFVRLGLVRYQPDTLPEMRVSIPTAQWVQLLPRRDITVTRRGENLRVTMNGQMSDGMKNVGYGDPAAQGNFSTPLLRVRLLEEEWSGQQIIARRERDIEGRQATPIRPLYSKPLVSDGNGSWQFDFVAPRPKLGFQFALYIEEIEMRRPAAYDREPIDIQGEDPFVPSGPRSAMHVRLDTLL